MQRKPSAGLWLARLGIFEYSHRPGIEVKPGLIMKYHPHVTSHQVSRYRESVTHQTRRHVTLQRRNKTVKWRLLTKTKEFWLNINNGDYVTRFHNSQQQWIPAVVFCFCEDVATKWFYQMIPRVNFHFTRWSRDTIMTWYRDVWQFVTCYVTPCPESER